MGRRRALLAALSTLMLVGVAPPAHAACHAFTVAVSPDTVDEGQAVTITVSRDGAVNPSQIDVSTVDQSAKAGTDYTAIDQTVSFTTETSKTLTLRTTDDTSDEPNETLKIHLSKPAGCAVNPRFSVAPDERVTIRASDAPTPTQPPTTTTLKATTSSTQTTTTLAATSSTTTTATAVTTTGPESSTTLEASLAGDSSDDGSGLGLIIASIVLILGAIGATIWAMRRRGSPPAAAG